MSLVVYNEFKNLIIGGDFNVNPWQRGTSFVSPTSLEYMADRFQIRKSGTQEFTVTKDPDSPAHGEAGLFDTDCMKFEVTTANASPSAGQFTTIEQPIEGYNSMPIYNNHFSISFWAFSSVPGIYCVAFQNAARDRNYIAEYTIVNANTWERFEFLIMHDASVGTWEITEQAGLRIIFTLNAGSALQGAANTWQAGNLVATANQTNFSGTIANDFRIALVRCTKDSTSDSYWLRDRMSQLALCQRYYQKSYNVGIAPGAISDVGVIATVNPRLNATLTITSEVITSLRATPSVTWYSPVTGAINNIANIDTASDIVILSTVSPGENHVGYPIASASVADKDLIAGHYTLEAEI